MKILVLLFLLLFSLFHIPTVISAACGYISNVAVDSLEIPSDLFRHSKMLRINDSNYYLIASADDDANLDLRTYQIWGNNGTINSIMVNNTNSGAGDAWGLDMCYIGSDIYITVGEGTTGGNNHPIVSSWRVWDNNGTINSSRLDYLELGYVSNAGATLAPVSSVVKLENDVCLAAYRTTDGTNDLYLESFYVDNVGSISDSRNDSITINGTGYYPKLIALDSNTVCVMYNDVDDAGWFKTYDVDSDGDIGDADDHVQDSWEFESDACYDFSFNIENVYGATYIISYYETSNTRNELKTLRISNSGTITKSFVDNMTLNSGTGGLTPTIFRSSEDIMGVAYRGPDNDGFIRTFNITETGYFDDLIIDTWEYSDEDISNFPSVIYAGVGSSDYFVVCGDEYDANAVFEDITFRTFQIECATGDIGEIGTLYVNVYDETDMTPMDFNISFFASDWGDSNSEIYCNTSCACPCSDCTDSWNISFADITPRGDGCYMIISNGSYHDRYFRMDIYDEFIIFQGETYYTLCLDIALAPETARMYTLKAIDDYYDPIEDVEIQIKRYIDATVGVVDISTLQTDNYGTAQCYLISLYPYIFNCSKENYIPVNFIWIPPDANNVTKTIKMSLNITQEELEKNIFDNITWYYLPFETYHHDAFDFTYYVNSSDDLLEYYNVSIFVYNNTALTWDMLNYSNVTTTSGGYKNYSFTNDTAHYKVVMCFKKTGFNIYCFTKEYLVTPEKTWVVGVPDFAYTVMLLVIMIIVMGFLAPYAGISTGYIGLGIFTIGMFMNPSLVISGVSGWAVLGLTFFMYTIGIFLWSRL